MNNKKTLLIILFVFVLLLVAASVLYTQLGKSHTPEQLLVQEPESGGEAAPDAVVADKEEMGTPPEGTDVPEEPVSPEKVSAPDFTVYDAEGNEVHLSDYVGKPIVLNFWASWCGPCQMETPDFQEKYLELGEEVYFMMINVTGGRETLDSAMAFVEESGYTFPVFYDLDVDAAMSYGAYSLPTTFFIDAEGYAVAQAVGAINSETLQRGMDMIMPKE